MKREKGFIFLVLSFIISITVLLLITILFYKKQMTIAAYAMNIIALLDIFIGLSSCYKNFISPYINNHLYIYDLDRFVDRDAELDDVIQKINSGKKIIYVSGRLGIGKTQFLHKLIYDINQEKSLLVYNVYPLYIDLRCGKNLRKAIKEKIQVHDDLNNIDLLKSLHKITKSRHILILLDNVDENLYLEMNEYINTLIKLDNTIIFVIASVSMSAMYQQTKMSNFSIEEVKEIAKKENITIDKELCHKIIEMSGGLPSIIVLLIKQLKLTGGLDDTNDVEIYIEQICHNLTHEQKDLIAHISYYSLIETEIIFFDLSKYYCYYTKHNIGTLVENGLIDYDTSKNIIIIQDYFANIIQNIFADKRFEISNSIYLMLEQKKPKDKYNLIFLLLTNIRYITEDELIMALSKIMDENEYQFLIYLFEILDDFHKLNKFYDSSQVHNKLLFCYVHSLLELGEYHKAQKYIETSDSWNKYINLRIINSQMEFDFCFDIADIDHFFGNYELAIESYMTIQQCNITFSQYNKCQWAIGHCYRHLGDFNSMNIALNIFEEIIKDETAMNNYYIRSYQSIVLIKLFLNDIEYNYESAFSKMIEFLQMNNPNKIKEIKTSRQYALYHRIILKNESHSLKILYKALETLEKSGIRIKYDYYFEIAETLRHMLIISYDEKILTECFEYYNKSLDFALKSGDISLKAISQIGIILLKIYKKKSCSKDLQKITELCDFCYKKKISYIFNYAYKIKDYLLNSIHEGKEQQTLAYNNLMRMNLFIM